MMTVSYCHFIHKQVAYTFILRSLMQHLCLVLVTAILFGETEYVISEGENVVTVCLSIGAGILERNVSVSLSTSGISAEGL